MSTFAFLVFFVQACLILNALNTCLGAPYGFGAGFAGPLGRGIGLAGPYGYGNGFGAPYGFGNGLATSFGGPFLY